MKVRRFHHLAIAMILAMGAVSCGDDDATNGADVATTETADDAIDEDAASEEADEEADPLEAHGESAGTITIGASTYELDPTIQCGFFPGDVISIAGADTDDAEIEITFDAEGADDASFSVSGPDTDWYSNPDIAIVVGDNMVSGTATATDRSDGSTADAAFEFHCD